MGFNALKNPITISVPEKEGFIDTIASTDIFPTRLFNKKNRKYTRTYFSLTPCLSSAYVDAV